MNAASASAGPIPPELEDLPYKPGRNKLGEWLCPGCGGEDFRLTKEPIATGHLFQIRCANCRREAGTGFPC